MTSAVALLALMAAAPAPTPAVRTIILLDESGSMVKNDPARLSEAAVRLYADLAGHQSAVGLVAFADRPRILVPLPAADTRADLSAVIRSLASVKFDGRTTDIEAALVEAEKMFRDNPRPGAKDSILLLTDGRVDFGPAADRATNSSIRRIEAKVVPRLRDEDIRLYTIAFTAGADRPLMERLAEKTNGAYRYLPDATALHKAFTELFTLAVEAETLPVRDGAFLTDEGIRAASIVMSKSAHADNRIRGPNDEVLTKDSQVDGVKWRAEAAYDHVTFVDPKAGVWNIEQPDAATDAVAIIQDSSVSFEATVSPRTVRAMESFEIQAMFIQDKKVSRSFALHKGLRVVATLATGQTRGESIELERYKDGTYRKTLSRPVGRYRLRLTARSETIEREKNLAIEVVGQPIAVPDATTPEHASESIASLEGSGGPGPWPWLFAAAVLVAVGAFGFGFMMKRRADNLAAQMLAPSEVLAPDPAPRDLPAPEPPDEAEPPAEPSWKVVLLTADDAELLTPSPESNEQLVQAIAESSVELVELKTTQMTLQESIDAAMQATADVTTMIQSLGSPESLSEELLNRQTRLVETMRIVDKVFGQLCDDSELIAAKAGAIQERLELFASESANGPDGPGLTHNEINELILSRADGQTHEEFEHLRTEMLDSLRNSPELVELKSALEDKSERMKSLEGTLAELKSERTNLEANLHEVTEEYQKMFNEFQS